MEPLKQFFSQHPFWAIIIGVFMILPMIGAVFHIVLKALGGKGIDNSEQEMPSTDFEEDQEQK